MSQLKLVLAEPKYIRDSVSIISELVNEALFKVNSNAIELTAMDPANVAMVLFKLLSSTFTEYHVSGDVEIGINLNNLKQILRRAKPSDIMEMELEESKLKLTFKGKTTRTFYLPILEIDQAEQRVPELSYPLTVHTTSALLDDAIADVDVVAESVLFSVDPNKFEVSAEGDLSKAKIEIPKDEYTTIETSTQDKIRAKYSIEYLKKMISASKISDKVTIQFNKDYPLKLEYKSVDKLLISFILAPRVEND